MNPLPASEPSVGPVRVRPFWTVVLYALLAVSAALALWARSTPDAPGLVVQTAPWVFAGFVVGFAVYRLALVMAKRYSAFKAFSQIGIAALFVMVLLGRAGPLQGEATGLARQLKDPNASVRALAAEVAGYRQDASVGPQLRGLLADTPAVAEAAHAALVRLNGGTDLGTSSEAWKERFP